MVRRPMDELLGSVAALREAYRRRRVSPLEVTRELLTRAERLQPTLNAFVTITAEPALAQARAAERRLARGDGERLPLLGVPITLKDLYDQRGVPTTAGSALRRGAVAQRDATVVRRLFRAGAVSLGKTTMHELAWGASGINPHFGPTRNPWDSERIAGGSSGGAGAAVAAGLGLLGMGSDTAGSVRVPAALCGVVGLKPTYGLVPVTGMVPLFPTLDHAGVLARTVADAAAALSVVAGWPGAAPASGRHASGDAAASLGGGVRGLRVGVMAQQREDVADAVLAAVDAAVGVLTRLGARTVAVDWPELPSTQGITAEGAALHRAAYEASPAGLGPELRRSLERAMETRAVDYLAALAAIREIRRRADELFVGADGRPVDVLVGPTAAEPARRLDATGDHGRPLIRLTRTYNVVGLPAVSLPCGFTPDGLPVGLQIATRRFDEATLLRAAHAYEQATDWHQRRPPLLIEPARPVGEACRRACC
jgi:aspartyl-tRNA(Asn)/glutamyl-tRNA(Gln) amidotransferase subunit A